jgi:2-dehydropantoate 2-reductase
MKVTIIGAGAMGGVTGAFMARAGEDVTLVDIVPEHVQAIQRDGLRVDGLEEFTVPVRAITPDQLQGPLEMVIIAVKTQQTQDALDQVLPHLDPQGYIVPMQNGFSALRIAERAGKDRVLPTSIATHQFYMGPGHVRYLNRGEVRIGEWDGRLTQRVEDVVHLLSNAYEAHATDNIWGCIWGKMASLSVTYPTGLVDCSMGPIITASDKHRRMFIRIAGEAAAAAKAAGVRMEPVAGLVPDLLRPRTDAEWQAAEEMMDRYAEMWWDVYSGVWRDLAVRKRPTGFDSILGPILDAGKSAGLDMALHLTTRRLLQEIETGQRQMAWENLDELIAISEKRQQAGL